MKIEAARAADLDEIMRVVEAAFGRPDEAALARRLAHDGPAAVSLVARAAGRIVGHILYSHLIALPEFGDRIAAVALAPLSVLPGRQRSGIGAALIAAGDEAAAGQGATLSVVLGDPGYYTRFGYRVEAAAGLDCAYAGPHLMAKPLGGANLPDGRVEIVYPAAFG